MPDCINKGSGVDRELPTSITAQLFSSLKFLWVFKTFSILYDNFSIALTWKEIFCLSFRSHVLYWMQLDGIPLYTIFVRD